MIDREARQIFAQLEMTSNGTTYGWHSSGGGKSGSRDPVSGDPNPAHVTYRERYIRAPTDVERDRVLGQARDELRRLQGRYKRPEAKGESPKQWRSRMVREGAGFDDAVVARTFNTTAKVVRAVRLEAKCWPATGRPIDSTVDGRTTVVELHAQGVSLSQIQGAVTGLSRSTIHRLVRKQT